MATYEFDRAFRVKILACLLQKNWYATHVPIIKAEYFPQEDEADFVSAIEKYYNAYSCVPNDPCDVETLISKAADNELIHEVFEASKSDLFLAEDLAIEFAKQQAVKLAILQSVDDIDKGDLSLIVSRMREAIDVGSDLGPVGLDPYVDVSKWLFDYWRDKVRTGWVHIDKVLEGGLAPQELGVILSPQNRGKSMSLINIGFGAASIGSGKNVVHIVHEMSVAQTAKRYAARTVFRFPKIDDDLRRYGRQLDVAAHRLVTGKIKIVGASDIKSFIGRMSVSDVRTRLNRLRDSQFNIDLIIDDYADLLKPSRKFSDRRFELSDIYQALRELAGEFECPLWTASQSRRSSHSKEIITMEDIAEDINKVSIADVVISLCQTKEEKDSNQCRLFTAKVRDGRSGMTFAAKFYPQMQSIVTTGIVRSKEKDEDA